jgi:hypothetical protein
MKFATMRFAFVFLAVVQLCMTLGITAHCVAPPAILMAFVSAALVFYLSLQTDNDALYLRLATHLYAMCSAAKLVSNSVDTCGRALYPLGLLRIVACMLETCVACEVLLHVWFDVYARRGGTASESVTLAKVD